MYIVIEGQDATGKSTQVELLAERLRKTGKLRQRRLERPVTVPAKAEKIMETLS